MSLKGKVNKTSDSYLLALIIDLLLMPVNKSGSFYACWIPVAASFVAKEAGQSVDVQ